MEQRMQVWNRRHVAKKSNLYMEEWLTGVHVNKYDFKIILHNHNSSSGYREKLFFKCKQLKRDGVIKDVYTDSGDIKVVLVMGDGDTEEKNIWSDKDIDQLEDDYKASLKPQAAPEPLQNATNE